MQGCALVYAQTADSPRWDDGCANTALRPVCGLVHPSICLLRVIDYAISFLRRSGISDALSPVPFVNCLPIVCFAASACR